MRWILFLAALVFTGYHGWYFAKTAPQARDVGQKVSTFYFEYHDVDASSLALDLLFRQFPLSEEAAAARAWIVDSHSFTGDAGPIPPPEEPFFQSTPPFTGLPGVLAAAAILFLLGMRRTPLGLRFLGMLGFVGASGLLVLQLLWRQLSDELPFASAVYANGFLPGAVAAFALATLLLLPPRKPTKQVGAVDSPATSARMPTSPVSATAGSTASTVSVAPEEE